MNYQASLTRLQERQKWLEDNKSRQVSVYDKPRWDSSRKFLYYETEWDDDKSKDEWELVKSIATGYSQSLAGEIKLDKVEQVFSKVHGFTKQKTEIKSHLLLNKYFKTKNIQAVERGKILCFVGPPGVGKTYFASQYAAACGRKFVALSVGGKSDPNLVQGVDKSYVNSHVGQIIQAIQTTQSCDPIILIDEIEKSGQEKKGSLGDALLHLLDPEQNQRFTDVYLNIPLDISRITFILTANDLEKIPDPLKNRLEVIQLKGYNEFEKVAIGKKIIEKIFAEIYSNANRHLFEMKEGALKFLISKTKEKGVRQLKRKIEEVINWCFIQWAQANEKGQTETKLVIDENQAKSIISENSDKEDSEEDKLKKKIEELEKENEDLKAKSTLNLLFKSLTLSGDQEDCDKCHQKTCQTVEEACVLCELAEQVKQFEAVINQENLESWEKIWKEQKAEWIKQSEKLQNGSDEEKELARQIKSKIQQIERKIQSTRKTISANSPKDKRLIWPWIVGGGIVIIYVGFLYGWLLAKRFGKKKLRKKGQLVKK